MKKIEKIIIGISVAAILISLSFFVYYEIFINSYWGESPKQPFFVNCTYYIYPNGTYLVLNITEVIQLGKNKPVLYYDDGSPHFYIDPPPPYSKQRIADNDHDGLLSVGDQIFFSMDNETLWNRTIALWYVGPDATGRVPGGGTLWDSVQGPYVWKKED